MFLYTALIYDGLRQHLVTHPCDDDAAFSAYLTSQYGIHVCLWHEKTAQKVSG
ncbi:hypothetical protein [Alteromonas sp. 14N.309.X.WAT.G.H12]|uniref:hypothetical protein n=1 Tax=Alteromonas sp. 14N.309.X.WAT.G.H12 TaxID=3120824 RepID=UPI002FD12775